MAPNITSTPTGVLFEDDATPHDATFNKQPPQETKPSQPYKRQIVWRNVVLFIYLHVAALYGAYLLITSAKLLTVVWAVLLYMAGGLGITAGAHRLWAHRSYKAKWPLKLILMIFNTLAFQNHAIEWARDHRVHHKFSETNADPHNATRGFFFAHVGWLLVRKHPDVKDKGAGIAVDDLERCPILAFQKKYYLLLMPVVCFLLPTITPVYLWDETWTNAWFVATLFRYTFTLNVTWLVNSAAHMWGDKPYDKSINPAENVSVAIFAFGEGWHNYHHVFPWDYKTAELGNYTVNFTTLVIDFFARIGWAYDMKTVPLDMVKRRAERTGDGSHRSLGEKDHSHGEGVWGWGDKDMSEDDKKIAQVVHPKVQ